MQSHTQQNGFLTLLSVLVVGAVGVAITLSLILLGLGSSRSGLAYQQLYQAKALTDACVGEALQQIRSSTPFTGSNTINLGEGSCSYTVTSQGGQNRTVEAEGTVGTIVRRSRVVVTKITPSITVSSWQEIGDF